MGNFRNLKVWQRSHALAVTINRLCSHLPWYERTDLCSQMRRAATSVPFNIAEGCGRKSASGNNEDLLSRPSISSGSLHELDSEIEYARAVEYIPLADVPYLVTDVGESRMMLAALSTTLRERDRHRRRSPRHTVTLSRCNRQLPRLRSG